MYSEAYYIFHNNFSSTIDNWNIHGSCFYHMGLFFFYYYYYVFIR